MPWPACGPKRVNRRIRFCVRMALLFELSGEHPVLPASEVVAAIEALGLKVTDSIQGPGVIVVGGEGITPDLARSLAPRLALTRRISRFLFACDMEEVVNRSNEIKLEGSTFCVRARCVQGLALGRDAKRLERVVGAALAKQARVDLEAPDEVVQVVLSDMAYVGLPVATVDTGAFDERKVGNRPYFSPISLHPKLARALVNLARPPPGGTVLDPFCGTGGILMEAALMGHRTVGGDAREDMVQGTRRNMAHFGLGEPTMFTGDVGDLPSWLEAGGGEGEGKGKGKGDFTVDAVATDPPYGRSTRTFGEGLEDLYMRAFAAMARVLAPGRYMSMSLPSMDLPLTTLARDFRLCGHYPYRVHSSLTRHFFILRRK